jgi:hypothetical protein
MQRPLPRPASAALKRSMRIYPCTCKQARSRTLLTGIATPERRQCSSSRPVEQLTSLWTVVVPGTGDKGALLPNQSKRDGILFDAGDRLPGHLVLQLGEKSLLRSLRCYPLKRS